MPPTSSSPSQVETYRIALPKAATPVTHGDQPGVSLDVSIATNLPSGTILFAQADLTPRLGAQLGVAVVHHGSALIKVGSNVCDHMTSLTLRVVVRPFYEELASHGGQSGNIPPPRQPASVLDRLGNRFQKLTGQQVTSTVSNHHRINQIVLTRNYAMPPLPSGFTPPPGVCG